MANAKNSNTPAPDDLNGNMTQPAVAKKPASQQTNARETEDEDTDLDLGTPGASTRNQSTKNEGPASTAGGRTSQGGVPGRDDQSRGSSIQGERQDAKGGPQGANQGGAPRGGSRIEPSHQKDAAKHDKR